MSARRSLIIAIVLLAVVGAASIYFLSPLGPRKVGTGSDTVRISMTTFNWGFNTTNIPNFQPGMIYESPTITVHKGQHVVIELHTLDITHGFAIDEYDIRVYIPHGETVTVSFTADKVGTFTYYCEVFCGVGHPHMHGVFQVLP